MGDGSPFGQKRAMDHSERQSQMKIKRMNDISDSDMNDSIDNMTSDDIFLPQVMQPQVTINESPRFDASTVKRENSDVAISQPQSPSSAFRASYRKFLQRFSVDYFQSNIFRTQKIQMRMQCKALPSPTTSRTLAAPT